MLAKAVLLATICCAPCLLAQDNDALVRKVDDHYNHLSSLRAHYTERYSGMGMDRTEEGTLQLKKPGRMRWSYAAPVGKVFVLDGKSAWFYTPGDVQATRVPAKELDDLRSPLRFLLGHTKIESELEGLKLTSPAQAGKSALYTLTGIPKGQGKRIEKLVLTVTASGAIQNIEIDEMDGAQTRFAFSGEEPNAVIPEGVFHFTPPAGVPVVDSLPPV